MSRITNSNYNHISVKTDSMVKMLEQLSKLGVLKSKRKSKPKRSKIVDEIKQDSDMVGYVKPIEGGQFGLRSPITQNQLEDIQRRNEATIARLSGEVQQQRLADIEAQQGQRFADITKLGGITNPKLERFRAAQDPDAGVYDPFMVPDVQEERFTQTINEGGPEAVEEPQSGEIYAGEEEEVGIPVAVAVEKEEEKYEDEGEEEEVPIAQSRMMPQEYIRKPRTSGKVKDRDTIAASRGLGPVPAFNKTSPEDMRVYYELLMSVFGKEPDPNLNSKRKFFNAINSFLDSQ